MAQSWEWSLVLIRFGCSIPLRSSAGIVNNILFLFRVCLIYPVHGFQSIPILVSFALGDHTPGMSADSSTASVAEPVDLSGGLAARLLRYFKAQVEDWYDVCRHLSDWEDRNLVDTP